MLSKALVTTKALNQLKEVAKAEAIPRTLDGNISPMFSIQNVKFLLIFLLSLSFSLTQHRMLFIHVV